MRLSLDRAGETKEEKEDVNKIMSLTSEKDWTDLCPPHPRDIKCQVKDISPCMTTTSLISVDVIRLDDGQSCAT